MPSLFDSQLVKTYQQDKKYLEQTEVPIITVSASYREDLKRLYGLPNDDSTRDIVFSRAHYSMALGTAIAVWGDKLNPKKAWLIDPTNYVSQSQWRSITFTETVGKTIARNPILKTLKDFVDKFGRSKLPILDSITPPLLYLTADIKKPILSFHIAAGNILVGQGKKVVQVVTDPHVREEYITNAHNKNITYCVFDSQTKLEFLEKAKLLEIKVDPERIQVTGPPIDPRIIASSKNKKPWKPGKTLKLCLTTGGLGTNKIELLKILEQLLPELKKAKSPYKLVVYAGTHNDIAEDIRELALAEGVKIGHTSDTTANLRLIYHPQIMDANELLVKYGFPWADGFITKPSGDMAYDAVASGAFLLTLAEWGEWEFRIREIFEQRGIARKCLVDNVLDQLQVLREPSAVIGGNRESWITQAMQATEHLEPIFHQGAKNIVKTALGVG